MGAFVARSHERASTARDSGAFDSHIVPIDFTGNSVPRQCVVDGTICERQSAELQLEPAALKFAMAITGRSERARERAEKFGYASR